ncbi:MAG: FlgD immunoglobulin-like domain containing protein [Myxococcales bacterium]|nr:flagellar hook assembly protein FlgD [Myxococcota bacterium]MDW8282816.1 FlgD immunoglobulin-like domain containing protein [Myxococcales bacterium]
MASTPVIAPSGATERNDTTQANHPNETTRSDFLKLLVAQMTHQDPLSPEGGTAFIAQLAQLAQTEQAMNQTEWLRRIQAQLHASAGGQAVGLLGREVTARFSAVTFDGQKPVPLHFTLQGPAASATLIIRDMKGNIVRTLRTGPLQAGVQLQLWDGKGEGGIQLAPGTYRVDVSATDAGGASVGATTQVQGRVTGVTFETGVPELLIGAARIQLADVALVTQ